ncbi:hypothetical protein CEUSTIGMA_g3694.t1 [Chlamydomonas eustigma]|uniref:Protein kinase domain-containing protein n=1 Tax=Chlamydomonas eustigma TaxID=1157962 RepID=A0A250X0G4_9CHLO|nr:hypothetical protein CEUSTIGMA_g3694.t1 [Chlamydomonas eustigma]|eukprot:GAX76250.1 hypothetical protein CEUSTIGMA_g3694.t1 [Chlamydomonas eustigma]
MRYLQNKSFSKAHYLCPRSLYSYSRQLLHSACRLWLSVVCFLGAWLHHITAQVKFTRKHEYPDTQGSEIGLKQTGKPCDTPGRGKHADMSRHASENSLSSFVHSVSGMPLTHAISKSRIPFLCCHASSQPQLSLPSSAKNSLKTDAGGRPLSGCTSENPLTLKAASSPFKYPDSIAKSRLGRAKLQTGQRVGRSSGFQFLGGNGKATADLAYAYGPLHTSTPANSQTNLQHPTSGWAVRRERHAMGFGSKGAQVGGPTEQHDSFSDVVSCNSGCHINVSSLARREHSTILLKRSRQCEQNAEPTCKRFMSGSLLLEGKDRPDSCPDFQMRGGSSAEHLIFCAPGHPDKNKIVPFPPPYSEHQQYEDAGGICWLKVTQRAASSQPRTAAAQIPCFEAKLWQHQMGNMTASDKSLCDRRSSQNTQYCSMVVDEALKSDDQHHPVELQEVPVVRECELIFGQNDALLGVGGFGVVRSVVWRPTSGCEGQALRAAYKCVQSIESVDLDICHEVQVIQQVIRHPRSQYAGSDLISVLAVVEAEPRQALVHQSTKSRDVVPTVLIAGRTIQVAGYLMPLMELGNLSQAMKQWTFGDRVLQRHDITPILTSILCALSDMHAAGFIHCDIKPENVLLHNQDGKVVGKLADMGLALATGILRQKSAGSQCNINGPYNKSLDQPGVLCNRAFGTPLFLAPEVEASSKSNPVWVTSAVDLFSFGKLLEEMMNVDFVPETVNERYFWAEAAQACTLTEPCERPSAGQLLDLMYWSACGS